MSSIADMDRAYDRFLSTSDLDSWAACLESYRDLITSDADLDAARPADIRRALTLLFYVAWMAAKCGEMARHNKAMGELDVVAARLAPRPPRDAAEGTMIRAVIAAAKGYCGTARKILAESTAAAPVEIAVLTAPERAMRKAEALRPHVVPGNKCFVPALYFYGSALLDLGYKHAAEELLDQHPEAESSAMIVDLRGQLLELAGSWRQARDKYTGSPWVSHAYRHAVSELILGAPVERLAEAKPESVARFAAGMMEFSSETDRAGVLRSESFIRACRWTGFDNWLVHFELGRVSFQRRCHAEAERRLAAAARSAPAAFRFPIHNLRHTNLGWLGVSMDINTDPESIEVGQQALQQPCEDADSAGIRLWIAQRMGELAPNDPLLSSDDHYVRGEAHALRGNIPVAIAAWCDKIAGGSTPRAFQRLVRTLTSYGFERAASSLAETAVLESEDSFFELWELAGVIADAIKAYAPARIDGERLDAVLAKVEKRLEAVADSEFQHAIRAFHHFAGRSRPEAAQRMLARVESLAEGSEELLLVAIARRKVGVGVGDPTALDLLRAAQRQSTDRLERLLIARELVHFGDVASARRILDEEEVFSDPRGLTALEYALALTSAAACAVDEERAQLEARAVAALKEDLEVGRFASSGRGCLDRLNACLTGTPLQFAFALASRGRGAEESGYGELVAELKRLNDSRSTDQELRVLNQQVEAMSGQGSPSTRFALWGLHLERLDACMQKIDLLRPVVADDELPSARALSLLRPRARQLAKAWRAHFQEPERAAQWLEEVRGVHATDLALGVRWKRLRSAAAAAPSKFALGCARQGVVLLRQISEDGGVAAMWPQFLDVGSSVAADAAALTTRLEAREASLQERLER